MKRSSWAAMGGIALTIGYFSLGRDVTPSAEARNEQPGQVAQEPAQPAPSPEPAPSSEVSAETPQPVANSLVPQDHGCNFDAYQGKSPEEFCQALQTGAGLGANCPAEVRQAMYNQTCEAPESSDTPDFGDESGDEYDDFTPPSPSTYSDD